MTVINPPPSEHFKFQDRAPEPPTVAETLTEQHHLLTALGEALERLEAELGPVLRPHPELDVVNLHPVDIDWQSGVSYRHHLLIKANAGLREHLVRVSDFVDRAEA